MTPKRFNELQRQADVIEEHAKNVQVDKAVELFLETIALEFVDIDEESHRWHDLYSKECALFGIMSKFDKSQSAEYKRRITSECFKWRIDKVKGFFCLNENHEFNDEGHGYIDTQVEWGDTKVYIVIYRKLDREPEFFVDLYGRENKSRETRIEKEKDMEKRFHNYISN